MKVSEPSICELDEFHYHEALHTAHIMTAMFTEWVADHPAVMQNDGLHAKAEQIGRLMAELYQDIGAVAAKEGKR